MELPLTRTPAVTSSPKKLLLYSPPKAGKTSLSAGLMNALIIDLEDGSDFVEGMKVKVKDYIDLDELCTKVIAAGRPYQYGILDTTTALEAKCLPLALKLYQQTPMGKNYTQSILSLPNGAGYHYLRLAYEMMLDKVQSAFPRVILLGHIKDKFIEKAGKEVSAKDVDLTGKVRSITCANADAIGYLYRDGNKTMVTFETMEEIICGARPQHLRNKVLVMAEYKPDTDKLVTYWEKIYID